MSGTGQRYIYSQLSAEAAGGMVVRHYSLTDFVDCKYFVLGLHDNYLIECTANKYLLRIYRNSWRTPGDIYFELELLAFIRAEGGRVAAPLYTATGAPCFAVDSPEGQRIAALFHYADGQAPGNEMSIQHSALLGRTVAQVHGISDAFVTARSRQVLDLDYLLDDSIAVVAAFVDTESRAYLASLQELVRGGLPVLSVEAPVYGICIGDVNPTNFHIDAHNAMTLFDFDQCGYGHRAFDIGKYVSSICSLSLKHDLRQAFIEGYEQVRRLSRDEQAAIPFFEIVGVIWVMAIHAANADRIGYKWLDKPFWDRRLDILKALQKQLADKPLSAADRKRV